MMIRFERSGPHIKSVPYCDEEGCGRYGLFGFDSNLGRAIDRKDAKLAGRHFCSEHNPDRREK